jgi:hypothetical protein
MTVCGKPSRFRRSEGGHHRRISHFQRTPLLIAALSRSRSLTSTCERHSVADGEDNAIDPLVACNFGVELAHRHRVRIGLLVVGDPPKPEHIVEDNQATRSNQPQRTLIIAVICLLIGIDESEIEKTRRPPSSRIECL